MVASKYFLEFIFLRIFFLFLFFFFPSLFSILSFIDSLYERRLRRENISILFSFYFFFLQLQYILTETVRRNLKDLVRVVSIGKIPVLLQGDTSVGKTSLITYLAKASGNICVRINNHEHTDLQEYVGSYIADETGKLVFREGILVEAMRKGMRN